MARPAPDTASWSYRFEQYPPDEEKDETGRALRAYIAAIPPEKLAQYRDDWDDETLMAWDDNFKSDGTLFLVCSEEDVDAAEFRRVLRQYFAFRAGEDTGR